MIDWAVANASQKALDRYKKVGKQYVAADDVPTSSGPGFLSGHIQYNEKDSTVEITSPLLKTEIDYWKDTFHIPRPSKIPDPGCFHYCKILSPARVMEWIYVDSLKGREKSQQSKRI